MISVIMVAVDGSRLLVFVTRFTEDIFACLISMIFISESLKFIIQVSWIFVVKIYGTPRWSKFTKS